MAKGGRFEHGSVLGGKTRTARVSSQWKSTPKSSRGLSRSQTDRESTVDAQTITAFAGLLIAAASFIAEL
jgi:hypothetical protein